MSIDVKGQTSLTERVGMEIKVAMVRAGISGRELARRLGTSQTWISTRVTGTTPIDLNDLQRIAHVLGVDVVDLIRSARHVTSRPFGPARRDPTRPVSAVPATRRRPCPTRPSTRPMPTTP